VSEPAAPSEPPTHHEVEQAEPPAHEPPRRRSTVREPVPFSFDDAAPSHAEAAHAEPNPPPPVPAPAAPEASEQPQEDDGKPRRTGWWAKRMLGG
jgi:ribonuclease E